MSPRILPALLIPIIATAVLSTAAETEEQKLRRRTTQSQPDLKIGARITLGEVVISATPYDINEDGVLEKVEIVLIDGRRFVDEERWCGNGEKWEGQFLLRVRGENRLLSETSLNALLQPDAAKQPGPISFWAPEFKLVMQDYNNDGQIDFNLGQYGSCVGNLYTIFSISEDGRVSVLPIAGGSGVTNSWLVKGALKENTTEAIKRKGQFVSFSYYSRSADRIGTIAEEWAWVDGKFVLASSKLIRVHEQEKNDELRKAG